MKPDTKADPVAEIAEQVRELTRPYHHAERYLVRKRKRQIARLYHAEHPSLLDQLRAAVYPCAQAEPGGSHIAQSSPPAELSALNALMRIEVGAVSWCRRLELEPRPTIEGCLSLLSGHARDVSTSMVKDLAAAVQSWWRWARVESQWDGRPRSLRDPCPLCTARALHVSWDVTAAWCHECGADWGSGELGVLGQMLDAARCA